MTAHPNEPTLKRLREIRADLVHAREPDPHVEKKFKAIDMQIERRRLEEAGKNNGTEHGVEQIAEAGRVADSDGGTDVGTAAH